ncbi:MAG TPA: hypothetical protein VF532_20945 [Candidatus Angelobacter sp.]
MSKVIVISQKGKLVGTWIPPQEPRDPNAPVARVIAGPGQKMQEIEIKDAEHYHSRGKSEDLTKLVKKQLKLK